MARKKREQMMGNNAGSAAALPIFQNNLTTTLVPQRNVGSGTPTFTRATTAYVTDFEGLLKPVLSGESRFTGARRVRNLVSGSSEVFTNAAWVNSGHTRTSGVSDPFGGTAAFTLTNTSGVNNITYQQITVGAGLSGRNSLWMRRRTGTGLVSLSTPNNGRPDISLTLTSSWQRISTGITALLGSDHLIVIQTDVVGDAIDVYGAMAEITTGQANTNPSEYVSVGVLSAPYHGAGVDGVKYFDTENGNTVSSNVVTEATGAAIAAATLKGYQAEGARTNTALWNRDGTNAAWTAGATMTVAKTATGVDGAANACTLLTGGAVTATNTLLQSITLASQANVFQPFIKRVTGTGTIEITIDGGTTWVDVTSSINNSTFTQVTAGKTAANPSIGFRITTSGDQIAFDMADCQNGTFASSPIPTTTVAITKNIDVDQYVSVSNLVAASTSMALTWTPQAASMGTVFLFGTYVDASNYTAILHDGTNIIARKRIGGSNNDATKALTYVAGTGYRIAARFDGTNGVDVWVAGVKGTNNSTTTASQIGTNFQIGCDGNGANAAFGNIKDFDVYGSSLPDARMATL